MSSVCAGGGQPVLMLSLVPHSRYLTYFSSGTPGVGETSVPVPRFCLLPGCDHGIPQGPPSWPIDVGLPFLWAVLLHQRPWLSGWVAEWLGGWVAGCRGTGWGQGSALFQQQAWPDY